MPYKKWDTPTDAVSQKKFDRYADKQVRKYVELKQEVRELRRTVKQILAWKADLFMYGKAIHPGDTPPPPK